MSEDIVRKLNHIEIGKQGGNTGSKSNENLIDGLIVTDRSQPCTKHILCNTSKLVVATTLVTRGVNGSGRVELSLYLTRPEIYRVTLDPTKNPI